MLDAWGPGNSRASSGDETRVIRASYGPNIVYTQLVARSIPKWNENERRWRVKLFYPNGALWMAAVDDSYEKASIENIRTAGLPVDVLEQVDLKHRYPQVNFEGLRWAVHERQAGFLLARRACQAVLEGFLAENGAYRQSQITPGEIGGRKMKPLRLSDASILEADVYVFACGPWLGELFPQEIGARITPTRQEVFYFGTPRGDVSFTEDQFPAWVDNSPTRFYGIPGNQWRGFKIAEDTPGGPFDPTTGDRMVTTEGLASIRRYLAFRFPSMKDAPLLESRVCQYEMSLDGGLIVDRHPACDNAWLIGGGSGHGFKFGPALGEHVGQLVLGKASVNPQFALARIKAGATGPGQRERK